MCSLSGSLAAAFKSFSNSSSISRVASRSSWIHTCSFDAAISSSSALAGSESFLLKVLHSCLYEQSDILRVPRVPLRKSIEAFGGEPGAQQGMKDAYGQWHRGRRPAQEPSACYQPLSSQSLHAPEPLQAGQLGSVFCARPELARSCFAQCSKLHASLQKFQFVAVTPQFRHSVVQSCSLASDFPLKSPTAPPLVGRWCARRAAESPDYPLSMFATGRIVETVATPG